MDQRLNEFKAIFDGTLDGWVGDASLWRVEGGVIIGESTKAAPLKRNQFLVWGQGKLDDFELRLSYKISGTEKSNSGVQVRSHLAKNRTRHAVLARQISRPGRCRQAN